MEKFCDLKYERPDLKKMKEEYLAAIAKFKAAATFDEANGALLECSRILDQVMSKETVASIRNTMNMKDEFYDAEMKFFNREIPKLMPLMKKGMAAALKSRFRPQLEEVYGKQYFKDAEVQQRFDAEATEGTEDDKKVLSDFVSSAKGVEWDDSIKYFVYAGTTNRVSSNDLPKGVADAYYHLVIRLNDFAIPDTLAGLADNLSALFGRRIGVVELDRLMNKEGNTANFVEVWHQFLKKKNFKDCPIDPAFRYTDFMRGWSAYIDGGGRLTKIPSMYRKKKQRLGF